jgi:hypothetical protein
LDQLVAGLRVLLPRDQLLQRAGPGFQKLVDIVVGVFAKVGKQLGGDDVLSKVERVFGFEIEEVGNELPG